MKTDRSCAARRVRIKTKRHRDSAFAFLHVGKAAPAEPPPPRLNYLEKLAAERSELIAQLPSLGVVAEVQARARIEVITQQLTASKL